MRIFDTWTQIPAGWLRVTEQIEVARFTGDSILGEPRIVPPRIRTKIPGNDYKARCRKGLCINAERLK